MKNPSFLLPIIPAALFLPGKTTCQKVEKPNLILIFIDDMGYGDLGCYGSALNRTPNIDNMAQEGMKFTGCYSASSVSTPSRASLLTGCYPMRVDMAINEKKTGMKQVLFPVSTKGLHPDEKNLADLLKEHGYSTACIGKWHLGDQPEFLPTNQGFDYFFGIPYSNDMGEEQSPDNPPLPLLRNNTVIEAPVNQEILTQRLTKETIEFIEKHSEEPFFIYLPHVMVHWPLHASKNFKGKSKNGIYGDAIEELDWSVGEILKILKKKAIDENTMILISSDNGGVPRLGASNYPFSGAKGMIQEGGFRVPMIARWPKRIPPNKECNAMITTMDIYPSMASILGEKQSQKHIIDGKDITSLLFNKSCQSPHASFLYYQRNQLQAIRWGDWKLLLPIENRILYPWSDTMAVQSAELYQLNRDISETTNVALKYPDIVENMLILADSVRNELGDFAIPGKNTRKAGYLETARPLLMQ